MATTIEDFLTYFLRTKLNEPTARKWTDDTLRKYASEAQRRFSRIVGKYGESGMFEGESSSITISASTESGDLPADFGGVKGDAVVWVRPSDSKEFPFKRLTRKDLQKARQDRTEITDTTTPPTGWFLRGTKLHVIPTNSNGWTVGMLYRTEPIEIVALANMGVEDKFLEIISLSAALMAIGDNERSDHDWARDFRFRMSEITDALAEREDETHEEQVESVYYDEMNSEGLEPYWDYSP